MNDTITNDEMSNPFLGHGGKTARPMRHNQKEAMIEVHQDRIKLARYYKAATEQAINHALDCPEGPRLIAMLDWMKTLGPDDAEEMISVVACQDWLLEASPELRRLALHLIDDQICRIRKAVGLRELDDPLPGEPDNVFQIIRDILQGNKK